jgi:hypothetical protein
MARKTSSARREFAEASYKAADGEVITVDWIALDSNPVVEGLPWRSFPWYLGQKSYSGLYWCATQSAHVGYESRLELTRLMKADYDASAIKIASQPFQLRAVIDGQRITRVPDYLVETDGVPLVIDVKPTRQLTKPEVRELLDLTRRVIESRGWRYEIATEPDRIEYLNLRFLAGYRRPWLFRDDILDAVRGFASSDGEMRIGEIVGGVEYPKYLAIPAVMHLLWRQELGFDISQRLSEITLVRAAS